MKIKCLIADDEELALDILEEFIRRIDFLQLEARCKNAFEVVSVLGRKKIDLMFLDIQMPELTGIQLLRSVPNLPPVIITTAYPNYALEGFELEVLDYLLKPIAFERFFKSVNRFFTQQNKAGVISSNSDRTQLPTDEFIFIKVDKQMVRVNLAEILYIESVRNYVIIHLAGKSTVKTFSTIAQIEMALPEGLFIRIHRSFIAAIGHIQVFNAKAVQIRSKYIPIGGSYQQYVLNTLHHRSIS